MTFCEYLKVEGAYFNRILHNFLINCLPDLLVINRFVRPALARMYGMKLGSGGCLAKGVFYGNPKNIQIGNKSDISRGVFFDSYNKITIGNNVGISFQVTFITSTHELTNEEVRIGELYGKPIVIGDGVWIGARAIIGPGVEIGSGSMIAAGAGLMRSVPANSLVVGIPGKVVTRLVNRACSSSVPETAKI